MKVISARQLWHDAFDTFEVTESIADKLQTFGVQFTARGAANRVMDQVERGIVQSVIARIKDHDPIAYHWGMAAYSPPGFRTQIRSRAHLLQHLLAAHEEWEFDFPRPQRQLEQLAFFCLTAACTRDVTGRRIDLRQARNIVGTDKKTWDQTWKHVYRRWEYLLDKLPARALGPVAAEIPRLRGELGEC